MSQFVNKNSIAYQNGNPTTGVSICIPRVFNNISGGRIKGIFIELNYGYVERVDVVPVHNKGFNRAFVHFRKGSWNLKNVEAKQFLTQLQRGESCRLYYDNQWFWQVSLSNAPRPNKAFDRKQPMRRKETLNLNKDVNEEITKPKSLMFIPQQVKQLQEAKMFQEEKQSDLSVKDEVMQVIEERKLNLNDPIQARIANQIFPENRTVHMSSTSDAKTVFANDIDRQAYWGYSCNNR
tara:strand:+ start:1520 stop:2227 length:708 start_codon:yes stop_codon:yes gene_type:complete